MCSVVGCNSWRRNAKRFNLPKDPDRRLAWVQFLARINGQRFKESCWTDITICSQHFTSDCFVWSNPASAGFTGTLRSNAVPSLCVKSESEETDVTEHVEARSEPVPVPLTPQSVPPEATAVTTRDDRLETRDSASSCCQDSRLNSVADGASPVPSDTSVKCSTVSRDGTEAPNDLAKEKSALLQMKGKYVVNENCLLKLFRRKCPLCGSECQLEKITHGLLIVLKRRCLRCEYRNDWKSQVNARVPAAEDEHQTGRTESTEVRQTDTSNENTHIGTPVVSEMITFSDEDNEPSGEGEETNEEGRSKHSSDEEDGEWSPSEYIELAESLTVECDEASSDEEENGSSGGLKVNELCAECGCFFNTQKPHTCVYKIKPYSCNICGKRCTTEIFLQIHSRIHDEAYEHPCKYCFATFKTRGDKLTHEQTHQSPKPYQCPECSKTFASNKARRIHLQDHKVINRNLICRVCGIEFTKPHVLRRHLLVHTGSKPHTCSTCHRGFSQASHLKSHMRLHTGERPYECRRCEKRFNHNVSLKSHVQRHHAESNGGDGQDDGIADEEEEEEVEEERKASQKWKRRLKSTGRPRGRPKRNAAGSLDVELLAEGQRPRRPSAAHKAQSVKRKDRIDDYRKEERRGGEPARGSASGEEKTAMTRILRSRGKSKSADSLILTRRGKGAKKDKKKNHTA